MDVPKGLEPATFVDSDFILSCNPTVATVRSKKSTKNDDPYQTIVNLTKKNAKMARKTAK